MLYLYYWTQACLLAADLHLFERVVRNGSFNNWKFSKTDS